MTTTTTPTSGAADLLTLIEAYAEAFHRHGHSRYYAQTAAALQAVKDALAAGQATAAQQSGAKLNYSVLYVYASQHGIDYNSLCVAVREATAQPVTNNRPSLESVFRGLSDRAYCNYIEQMGRDACLGWEHKAAHGKFGEAELKGHTVAGEMLGRHKAFAEAANALRGSDAPLIMPSKDTK